MIGFRFPAFGWGASFWAFLATRISQHWAFLADGRQGFFNSSVFVQPCRGKKFSCNGFCFILQRYFFCAGIKGIMGFVVFWFFRLNIIFSSGGIFLFFVVFVGGDLCILCITLVSGLFILGVWVPGGFIGGPGHIFLCGTPLCGVPGRYNLFEC